MSDERTNLPDMEEAVAELVANLGSARSIHDRLDVASTAITVAQQDLGEANRVLAVLQADASGTLDQIKLLQPERLEHAIDAGVGAITRVTTERLGVLDERLARLASETAASNGNLRQEIDAAAELNRTGNAALLAELGIRGDAAIAGLRETTGLLASRVDESVSGLTSALNTANLATTRSVSTIADSQKALATDFTSLQERQFHHQRTIQEIAAASREISNRLGGLAQDLHRQQSEMLAVIARMEAMQTANHAELNKQLRGSRVLVLIGFVILALATVYLAIRLTA